MDKQTEQKETDKMFLKKLNSNENMEILTYTILQEFTTIEKTSL